MTACVDKVQIADNLQLLDSDKIPKVWKTAVDANGKLVQNHLSYIKKGDGVNNLDSVVREENMDQKLLFLTVTYTNISEEELNHMLYLGTLIALSKQNDGTYTIYMPGTEAGEDYDYYISDSVAKTAEMTYSSVQDDYGQGKNYIPSLKPGESVQVNEERGYCCPRIAKSRSKSKNIAGTVPQEKLQKQEIYTEKRTDNCKSLSKQGLLICGLIRKINIP